MIASETVNRFFKSSAVCQPGLNSRCAGHAPRSRVPRIFSIASSAACISSSSRTIPTLSCIVSCRSRCTCRDFRRRRAQKAQALPATPDFDRCRSRLTIFFGVFRRKFPGPFSENHNIGERISAESIRAVDSGGAFAGGEKPGYARHLGIGVDTHAAHDVVRRRADFHRLLGDVDVPSCLN